MSLAGAPIRVAVAGPHPERIGGVASQLRLLQERLDPAKVRWIGTGRRTPWDLVAPARDLHALRGLRRSADLLHLNPSLRRRALWRDLSLAQRWGGPAVLWIHGWDRRVEQALRRGPLGRILRGLVRQRVRIAVLAPNFRERLVQLGIPEERIDLLPPGWSGAPQPRAVVPGTVLFLGRLVEEKGLERLIEAVGALGGVELWLAGTGPLEATLRAAARAQGVALRALGWVEGEAKWKALARAQLMALPSESEGVPVSLIEALAAGTPVVASAVGGVPWLLQEGRVGRLVSDHRVQTLTEALRAGLSEPGSEEIARQGRARAAELSADALVERIQGIWQRALR